MQKTTINIVWLKRDLRTQDHGPLFYAEKAGLPYIILFLFEPALYNHPDTSLRHLQFQYRSILSINQTLNIFQKSVVVCHGNADDIFAYWMNQYNIQTVFSYRESGIELSYQRDKKLKKNLVSTKSFGKSFNEMVFFVASKTAPVGINTGTPSCTNLCLKTLFLFTHQ